MKNLSICLICILISFNYYCSNGQIKNQQKSANASSQNNSKEKEFGNDSTELIPAKTICNQSGCSTFVFLKNGLKMFAGEYPKEPFIRLIDSTLLQLTISCGSPCNYTLYINLINGIQSKSFFNVLAVDVFHGCVAYCDTSEIIISSIFDSKKEPIEIKRNYAKSASMSTLVDSVSFKANAKFVFHYYASIDYSGIWDSIDVKF